MCRQQGSFQYDDRLLGLFGMALEQAGGCGLYPSVFGGAYLAAGEPAAEVFIRPERYTHGIIEENEFMTLSFLGHSEEARKIYNFCGSKSGRDLDKVKETGLIPVETDNGSIAFEQSRLTLECRKLYKDSMTAEKFLDKDLLQWYGAKGGFHDVYVVEITNAYKK